MIIETVILSCLTAILGAVIGYLVGIKDIASVLRTTACGWQISAWKSVCYKDKFFMRAEKGDNVMLLTIGPNGIDFDLYKDENNGKQR